MNKKINKIHFNKWDNSFIPHILKELYIDRVYDSFLVGKKDLIIIDLGANIGLWSMYAAEYAKHIYAFEPSEKTKEVLTKNLAPIEKMVTVCPYAISNKNEQKKFFTNPSNTTANTLLGGSGDHCETVNCLTLDTAFEKYKIEHVDFMKIDIEGSEFDVLGGSGFEKVAPKIDCILGEMHSWVGRNYNQLKFALELNGFAVKFFKRDASLFSAVRKDT